MSMDTEAIYSAIGMYAGALAMRDSEEAGYQMAEVRRLLNEADEEHKSLLAENERLVDEVNEARKETGEQAKLNDMGAEREARLMAEVAELKAKLAKKAELLRGCYAADHKRQKRVAELEATLSSLYEASKLVSVGQYDQEQHDIAVSKAAGDGSL